MAFGMKHWLGIVVVSLALIVAWLLPLDFVTPGQRAPRTAEEQRYEALARELRETRTVLDQVRRAGTLPALVVAAAEDGVGVIVPRPNAEVTPGNGDRLREKVRGEVESLGRREPAMVLGYAYDGADGGATGLAVSQGSRVETYLGEQDGTSYCLQVVVSRTGMIRDRVQADLDGTGWTRWTGNLLGPCALYAKHGPASESVQAWLEAGGMDFALGRRGTRRVLYPVMQRRSFMAIRLASDAGSAMESERCHTGESEACASMFLDPGSVDGIGARLRQVTQRSPAIYSGSAGTGPFPFESQFLLHDLEAEFGREAFQRFWTSDGDIRSAFEAAFSIDPGEWVVEWIDKQWGIEASRPGPTLSATLGSLLLVSLVTGLATFMHRRRQVA